MQSLVVTLFMMLALVECLKVLQRFDAPAMGTSWFYNRRTQSLKNIHVSCSGRRLWVVMEPIL